jgi:hypothetical protein
MNAPVAAGAIGPGTRVRGSRLSGVATLAVMAIGMLAAPGCLDDTLDPDQASPGSTFIALTRDFQPFRGWTRTQVGEATIVGGHPAGPRFTYINDPPSDGRFPVGTMIVKTVELGEASTWTIHARAKRGGTFNAQQAIGWEWFELRIDPAGQVGFLWRGEKPPKDHGYESLPGLGVTGSTETDCNTCHVQAAQSEYILAPALRAELGL